MRHIQNTYDILRKAFNTHAVLVSHSLVISFGRGASCPLPNKIIKQANERADATDQSTCLVPLQKEQLAPGTLSSCSLGQTLPTVLEATLSAAKTGRTWGPRIRKYSTACTPSCVFPLPLTDF